MGGGAVIDFSVLFTLSTWISPAPFDPPMVLLLVHLVITFEVFYYYNLGARATVSY